MSYDFLIYTRRDRLPAPIKLMEELVGMGLAIEAPFDILSADGYFPVLDTGFEVYCDDITSSDIEEHANVLRKAGEPDDEHLSILRKSDIVISFGCRDDHEISTAKLIAGAIAKLSYGYIRDPQKGAVVRGEYLK